MSELNWLAAHEAAEGMPALSLPLLQGENGLPIGVQLVGRRGDDARLLRTANWLMATLQ